MKLAKFRHFVILRLEMDLKFDFLSEGTSGAILLFDFLSEGTSDAILRFDFGSEGTYDAIFLSFLAKLA